MRRCFLILILSWFFWVVASDGDNKIRFGPFDDPDSCNTLWRYFHQNHDRLFLDDCEQETEIV